MEVIEVQHGATRTERWLWSAALALMVLFNASFVYMAYRSRGYIDENVHSILMEIRTLKSDSAQLKAASAQLQTDTARAEDERVAIKKEVAKQAARPKKVTIVLAPPKPTPAMSAVPTEKQ